MTITLASPKSHQHRRQHIGLEYRQGLRAGIPGTLFSFNLQHRQLLRAIA